MSSSLRIAYFAHTLRSDWNNGNAHFLRGLMRALGTLGHQVTVLEPQHEWSLENLQTEPRSTRSLADFARIYPDLNLQTYTPQQNLKPNLADMDIVILHEWNPPALAQTLLALRDQLGFKLLFHDTHHRASSTPEQIALFGLARFDGVLAFGEALRTLYRERFAIHKVWTLHEAADTTVFHPHAAMNEEQHPSSDAVWIGNWGEGERTAEITDFYLKPAAALAVEATFTIYGVRYPQQGLEALQQARVRYGGYLPNLDAPGVYAASRLTIHIPRQQYSGAMTGIPTIRVFEALACGIPLLSAPWQDTEQLFRPGDFQFVANTAEATEAMHHLLAHPAAAQLQAARGLETILARHTCLHRAQELTAICKEVLP